MKKITKQITAFALALVTALTAVPLTAQAAVNAPSSVTVYQASADSNYSGFQSINIANLSKDSKITNVKSSNKSVAELYSLEYDADVYSNTTEYLSSDAESTSRNEEYYSASLTALLKKTGSTKISYTIGKKDYTTALTVKKYTNPLKTLKITGIKNGSSSNLASMVDQASHAYVALNKNQKNASVTLEAKKGWVISYANVYAADNGTTYTVSSSESGLSSISLNIGALNKNTAYQISISMKNAKNNGTIFISYYLSSN
jgi:hypothetical protein